MRLRIPLLIVVTVLTTAAVGVPGAVASPPVAHAAAHSAARPAAEPGWAPRGAAAAAPARRESSAAHPLAAHPYSIPSTRDTCWSNTLNDALGDASVLDIASGTLQYNCATQSVTVGITTVDAFATPEVQDFVAAFDTDGNPSTGCDGADLYAEAAWESNRGQMLAVLYNVTSCGAPTSIAQWLVPERSDSHNLYLSFPESYITSHTHFGWNVIISPDPDSWDTVGYGSLSPASIPDFPPSGSTAFSGAVADPIYGPFTALVPGDFNGDGKTDFLAYRAGTGADAICTSLGGGHFSCTAVTVNNTYDQIIPGDFDHDGQTDLLFYKRGTPTQYLWTNIGTGHPTTHTFTIRGSYIIVPGDFNGDGYTDLLFYAPGPADDYVWSFGPGLQYTSTHESINGSYRIVPGDFNGDHRTDLLFYAPGAAPDYIWTAQPGGGFVGQAYPIYGTYTDVIPGDFNGDGKTDLFFWARGWAPDALLRGSGSAPYLTAGPPTIINEFYDTIVPGDFNGDGKTDLYLITWGAGADKIWNGV